MIRDGFRGAVTAVKARRRVFLTAAVGFLALNFLVPPLILSLVRMPVNWYTLNPYLSRLPEYLLYDEDPVSKKIEFVSQMAVFWWGATQDVADNPVNWAIFYGPSEVFRYSLISIIFGTYFSLWSYLRNPAVWGRVRRAGAPGGYAGMLLTTFGFTTTPCSLVGCGYPVLPVLGLAFVGVSSGLLAAFAAIAGFAVYASLVLVGAAVIVLGSLVYRGQSPTVSTRASA